MSTQVLVYNKKPRTLRFPMAKAGRGGFEPGDFVECLPGLTMHDVEVVASSKLDDPKLNPHLATDERDGALRIIGDWRDLGEGDAVHAVRGTGDIRMLRAIEPFEKRPAVCKAIRERIAEIESGKRREAEAIEYHEESIDLGEVA